MSRCKRDNRRYVTLFGVLTALTVLFIWSNSCLSREVSGAQSGNITRFLCSILDPNGKLPEEVVHHFVRKTAHFVEFAALGVFVGGLFLSIRGQGGKAHYALPVLLALLVAVLDEYIQYFTGRGSAVTDVMLDFSGALTGLAASVCVWNLRRKISIKK